MIVESAPLSLDEHRSTETGTPALVDEADNGDLPPRDALFLVPSGSFLPLCPPLFLSTSLENVAHEAVGMRDA